MRILFTLLISIFLISLGYIVGQFIPWEFLNPTILKKEITMNDFYTRLISIIGALATIFATMVALFKEDIISYIKSPKLNISFKNDMSLDGKELSSDLSISIDEKSITAYVSQIEIINNGKGTAKNVEIIVDKIYSMPSGHVKHTHYDINQFVIKPIGKEIGVFNLHKIKGKALLTLIEISLPQVDSTFNSPNKLDESSQVDSSAPKTSNVKTKPTMKIGDFVIPEQDCNFSEMFIEIIIYADNCDHIHEKIKVAWSGEWKNNLEAMRKVCKIELVKK